jgi:hypothetical protein
MNVSINDPRTMMRMECVGAHGMRRCAWNASVREECVSPISEHRPKEKKALGLDRPNRGLILLGIVENPLPKGRLGTSIPRKSMNEGGTNL